MKVIADSGIEEILMLTGESKSKSSITYIGDACRLAKKYFRNVGLEIYPCNTKDYAYLHECGADYVTVFRKLIMPTNMKRFISWDTNVSSHTALKHRSAL